MRLASSRVHVLAASAFALAVASVAACSGSPAPGIGTSGLADGGPGSSADGSPSGDGSSGDDSSVTVDSGGPDGSRDPVVQESPAPVCHDLTQLGGIVTAVGNVNQPPAQVPITTITPGYYVLTATTDYGGVEPIAPVNVSKTTLAFTATRQYYLSEDATGGSTSGPQVFTLDWRINNNRLIRKIVCAAASAQIGSMVDYRIDRAATGFIIYVPVNLPGGGSRVHAYRYDRIP